MFNLPHLGELLKVGYIDELKISVSEFAFMLGLSRKTFYDIINEKTAITSAMALRISKAFNTEAEFWLNLQMKYDLFNAMQTTNLDDVKTYKQIA